MNKDDIMWKCPNCGYKTGYNIGESDEFNRGQMERYKLVTTDPMNWY